MRTGASVAPRSRPEYTKPKTRPVAPGGAARRTRRVARGRRQALERPGPGGERVDPEVRQGGRSQ